MSKVDEYITQQEVIKQYSITFYKLRLLRKKGIIRIYKKPYEERINYLKVSEIEAALKTFFYADDFIKNNNTVR